MFKEHPNLGMALFVAYTDPFKLQSDFARLYAQEVACLACMGFISTLEGAGVYGRKWRITGIGLDKLRKLGVL